MNEKLRILRNIQFGRCKLILRLKRSTKLVESSDGVLTQAAFSHLIQHSRKDGISLTEDLVQSNRMLDTGVPGRRIEGEFGDSVAVRYRRQLEEIAGDD